MQVCLDWIVFVFIWQGPLSLGKVFHEGDASLLERNQKEITTSPLMTSMSGIYMNLTPRRLSFTNIEIKNSKLTTTLVTGSKFPKSETLMTSSEDTKFLVEFYSVTSSGYGYLATPSLTISNADETRRLILQPRDLDRTNTHDHYLTSTVGQPSQQKEIKPKTTYKEITTLTSVTRMEGMYKNLSHSSRVRTSNGQAEDFNVADLNDESISLNNSLLSNTQSRFDCDSIKWMSAQKCKKELKGEFSCLNDVSSCRDRCGLEAITTCSCELHCELYGTCCVDFRSACPDLWLDAKEKLSGILGVTVGCIENSPGYILISSCSQNSSSHIVSKCLGSNTEPVSINNYHFRNIHCLLCNGFGAVNVQSWTLKLRINFVKDIDPSFFEKTDISLISTKGIFQWTSPPLPNLHLCSDMLISDCPEGNDGDLKDKCLASRSPVSVVEDGKIALYHNKYCAACHVRSSLYVCYSAAIHHFAHVTLGPGRFSTTITWQINSNKTGVILQAKRPFVWKTMDCNIRENDIKMLNCVITACHYSQQLVNDTCVLSSCAKSLITWNGQHQVDATCMDQSCINTVIDRMLARILQNVHAEFPGMTLGATSRNMEKYELYIKMMFNNRDIVFSDSETLQRLFGLYEPAVQDILKRQIASGSTISIRIRFTSNKDCLVTYQSRNFTIIDPSSGGGSSCSFLAVILACIFLNLYRCHSG